MKAIALTILAAGILMGCGRGASASAESTPATPSVASSPTPFDADSAYAYVERQVAFGPRVPGTSGHAACGDWLEGRMKEYADTVISQRVTLRAFDGTPLPARNIMARFNPQAPSRTLLLAHWDTRPWADNDPAQSNRDKPVPGANDGASGVGVLMEVARQLRESGTQAGVDILFVDAEDYGSEDVEESWALGARYFVQNPPVPGYVPARAVLLDMVGGEGSVFAREYFSQNYAPQLLDSFWAAARDAGHASLFSNETGPAITDDHLEFIKAVIPAIYVIAFSPEGSFLPTWHTLQDDMAHISRETLGAVGSSLMHWLSELQ